MILYLLLLVAVAPLLLAIAFRLRFVDLVAVIVAARSLSDVGAGAATSSLLPSGLLSQAIGGVCILLPLLALRRTETPLARPILVTLATFVALTLPSVSTFGWDGTVIGDVFRLLSVVVLGVVVASLPSGELDLPRFLTIAVTPALLIGALGLVTQAPWAMNPSGRAAYTFSHPNSAGAFFAVAAFAAVVLWLWHRTPTLALLAAGSLVMVLGTQSLGSLIGLAAAIGVVVLADRRFSRTTQIITLGLAGMFAGAALTQTSVFTRLQEFQSFSLDDTLASSTTTDSFSWRIVNWYRLLEYWEESPLWGNGLGSTMLIQPMGSFPHSAPVELLVETGVIGLGLATVGLLAATVIGFRLAGGHMPIGPICLGLVAFAVANGSESNLLRYTSVDLLMAALFGIAVAQRRTQRNLKEQAQEQVVA